MEQKSLNPYKKYSQHVQQTIPIEITRILRAPMEWIWKAWSDAEIIKEWWGPKESICKNGEINFQIGGRFLFDSEAPDGKIIWSTGVYEEISKNKEIVFSEQFSDQDGNVISAKILGMPGNWPAERTVSVEFEKIANDQVKMIIHHKGIPPEMHDDYVEGWNQSLDKFQAIVERYGDEHLKQEVIEH